MAGSRRLERKREKGLMEMEEEKMQAHERIELLNGREGDLGWVGNGEKWIGLPCREEGYEICDAADSVAHSVQDSHYPSTSFGT